jgi:putative two-component system response regulator
MKTHSSRGAEALELVEQRHPESIGHLVYAKQIARHHHEKWDGSGYPDGLAGEAIPLAARLMALADVFDALLSKRVYKASWSTEEVFQYIEDARGSHFDPRVVDACLARREDFMAIAARYAD